MNKKCCIISDKDFRYLYYEYNELHCKNCNTITVIENSHYKVDESGYFIGWLLQYQCQHCGKLKIVEEGYKPIDYIGIPKCTKCECGGQLRRDTPIFCPICLFDKTEDNIELPDQCIVYNHRFDLDNTIKEEDIDGDRWLYLDKKGNINTEPF
jgi:hypothetical protein